jgi:hypothetical protein
MATFVNGPSLLALLVLAIDGYVLLVVWLLRRCGPPEK